jgi:hypothetical protein
MRVFVTGATGFIVTYAIGSGPRKGRLCVCGRRTQSLAGINSNHGD